MARRINLSTAKALGFAVLTNSAKPNPIPLKWAEELEDILRVDGWTPVSVVLIDGLCSRGTAQAIGGGLIGFYANDLTHDQFMETGWHEKGHNLNQYYGTLSRYPRPPIEVTNVPSFNMDEVAAEDFRQLFGPPEVQDKPHKYAQYGYGLGYELPSTIPNYAEFIKLRQRLRQWWLMNCNEEYINGQKNWMTLTAEKLWKLITRFWNKEG